MVCFLILKLLFSNLYESSGLQCYYSLNSGPSQGWGSQVEKNVMCVAVAAQGPKYWYCQDTEGVLRGLEGMSGHTKLDVK